MQDFLSFLESLKNVEPGTIVKYKFPSLFNGTDKELREFISNHLPNGFIANVIYQISEIGGNDGNKQISEITFQVSKIAG